MNPQLAMHAFMYGARIIRLDQCNEGSYWYLYDEKIYFYDKQEEIHSISSYHHENRPIETSLVEILDLFQGRIFIDLDHANETDLMNFLKGSPTDL